MFVFERVSLYWINVICLHFSCASILAAFFTASRNSTLHSQALGLTAPAIMTSCHCQLHFSLVLFLSVWCHHTVLYVSTGIKRDYDLSPFRDACECAWVYVCVLSAVT